MFLYGKTSNGCKSGFVFEKIAGRHHQHHVLKRGVGSRSLKALADVGVTVLKRKLQICTVLVSNVLYLPDNVT